MVKHGFEWWVGPFWIESKTNNNVVVVLVVHLYFVWGFVVSLSWIVPTFSICCTCVVEVDLCLQCVCLVCIVLLSYVLFCCYCCLFVADMVSVFRLYQFYLAVFFSLYSKDNTSHTYVCGKLVQNWMLA
jgi:hypothetical protein